tara:strand:+ start:450 stop:794 length:345 start_codon:yes stop_codon:yes gene_type:complete
MKDLKDEEVFEIVKPIWINMNDCSNRVDYFGFSKDFDDELKSKITKERFESQCKKHPILTSLVVDAEPIACIRRKEGYGIVFRQLSTTQEGEFMGNLVVNLSGKKPKVIDATIY